MRRKNEGEIREGDLEDAKRECQETEFLGVDSLVTQPYLGRYPALVDKVP
jgi:hypothetical protein